MAASLLHPEARWACSHIRDSAVAGPSVWETLSLDPCVAHSLPPSFLWGVLAFVGYLPELHPATWKGVCGQRSAVRALQKLLRPRRDPSVAHTVSLGTAHVQGHKARPSHPFGTILKSHSNLRAPHLLIEALLSSLPAQCPPLTHRVGLILKLLLNFLPEICL